MRSRQTMTPDEVEAMRQRMPALFGPSAGERARQWILGFAFAGFSVYALDAMDFFDWTRIVEGLGRLSGVLAFMFPPAHNGHLGQFIDGILETLAMAFLGTLGAALIAVPLGFLAAKNLVPNWLLHFGLRRFFDGLRAIDALIWALVFINVVGLGPFAGILAIMVSDAGTLAKLYSEAIENIEKRQVEGVRAAGGNGLDVVRLGMLPQVLPVMLSQGLYYLESNTRSATILGIVGAGGIGLHLSDRIRLNNWDEALFIILMILVTVSVLDALSRLMRQYFIGTPSYRP